MTQTTDVVPPQTLPKELIPEGFYRIDQFAVPFDIGTRGSWTRYMYESKILGLGRGPNAETEFLVSSGLTAGATAQDAADGWCNDGSFTVTKKSTTKLLGHPAVQYDGTLTKNCIWADLGGIQTVVPKGHTARLVAADVDGKIVLVLVDAPADSFLTLVPEAEAMIASMSLIR